MNTTPNTFTRFLLIALALLACSCLPVVAADKPGDTSYTVGILHVQSYGSHGQPLILIPGLGSGAWVWQDTVEHLKDTHRIHVLTLAGFDGTAAPEKMDDLMGQAQASLQQLIAEHKIDQPVLIGHSLGGTLVIAFAEQHPGLIAGVIAVDGMPIFPGFERLDPEQREAAAERMKQATAGATKEAFAAQQTAYLKAVGVLDPDAATRYGALQARSDAKVVAQFAYEDLRVDLRPGLSGITVPLLEIAPYNKPDFEAAAASGQMPMLEETQIVDYYRGLLDGAPKVEVRSISPSRHFVMLDQPDRFRAVVTDFLANLK